MTVSSNSRRREYQGNGVTQVFNGPMAYARAHVYAFLVKGNTMTLVPSASFDVEKLGYESGTRVTMHSPPAADEMLLLLRTMPYTQETDITNQGAFHAETIEKGFDALEMQIQQLVDGTIQLVFEDGEFVWDAKGSRIVRVGDPRADQDAVNLRTLYLVIEQIQNGGGVVGVSPKYWEITGDGEDTDFELPGSDVSDLLFYDVVVEGLSKEPYDEYTVVPASDGSDFAVRFPAPLPNGAEGFVILRGYAKPFTGTTPVQTLRIPIIDVDGITYTVDKSAEFALLRTTNVSPCLLTLRANQGDLFDMADGSYFSVCQRGDGQARIVADDGVTLVLPGGFLPYTRTAGSIISAVCEYAEGDTWIISGDLAQA